MTTTSTRTRKRSTHAHCAWALIHLSFALELKSTIALPSPTGPGEKPRSQLMRIEPQIFDGILMAILQHHRLQSNHLKLSKNQLQRIQHHFAQRRLQCMAHLQAVHVQCRICDNSEQLALLFSKNKNGIPIQASISHATCEIRIFPQKNRKPRPMLSFLRHVTSMKSPNNPSYVANHKWPVTDLQYLRIEATFENIAAHQAYLEKLQFEQNTLRSWSKIWCRIKHGKNTAGTYAIDADDTSNAAPKQSPAMGSGMGRPSSSSSTSCCTAYRPTSNCARQSSTSSTTSNTISIIFKYEQCASQCGISNTNGCRSVVPNETESAMNSLS